MKIIQFTSYLSSAGYNPGEVASFTPEQAERFIALGVAVEYVVKAAAVPEPPVAGNEESSQPKKKTSK